MQEEEKPVIKMEKARAGRWVEHKPKVERKEETIPAEVKKTGVEMNWGTSSTGIPSRTFARVMRLVADICPITRVAPPVMRQPPQRAPVWAQVCP